MLGFGDFWVFLGYLLTILATIGCVVYGLVNWNKPKEDPAAEANEEVAWEQRDPEMSEGGGK